MPKLTEPINPEDKEAPDTAKGAAYENHLARMVQKGPYKTKGERWNAMSAVLKLNETRLINGFKPVSDEMLHRRCGFTYEELYKEAANPDFRDMRQARAKGELGDALTDVVGHVRATLKHMAEDAVQHPKDEKKREKFLQTALTFAEKYGIYEVDSSKANQNQELNTAEAVSECLQIMKELTGVDTPVQKFLKVAVIDGANSGGGSKDGEVDGLDPALEAGKVDKPS